MASERVVTLRRIDTRKRFVLAAVPICTLGIGSCVPFAHAAFRWRWPRAGVTAGIYLVLTSVALVMCGLTETGDTAGVIGGAVLVSSGLIATGHWWALTDSVIEEFSRSPVGTSFGDPAVQKARERVERRAQARNILTDDPQLARELKIGRTDLTREFDDGGLVDVNRVGAAALARALELSEPTAALIIEKREAVGGFISYEEFCVALDELPERFDDVADLMVFWVK